MIIKSKVVSFGLGQGAMGPSHKKITREPTTKLGDVTLMCGDTPSITEH